MLYRRDFLALGAAAMTQAAPAQTAGEWRNRQSGMAYRRLGRTGFMISEIVMGGNRIRPDNHEFVLAALDMGLNYLDTAPAYGRGASELGYAKVIAARKRDSFFLTTKVSAWAGNRARLYKEIFDSLPEAEQKKLKGRAQEELEKRQALEPDHFGSYFANQEQPLRDAALNNAMAEIYGRKIDREKNYKQLVIDSLHESLRRLGTDHVDLLLCPHGASTAYELLQHPEIFEAYEILRKQGKVRHLGVSAHNDPGGILEAAVDAKVYSMAMVAYNIVNRRWVESALERARRHDLGVVAMKVARPVHNGRGDGTVDDPRCVRMIEEAVPGPLKVPQKAYLWALRNANLSGVISEMASVEMVRDNLPLAARKA